MIGLKIHAGFPLRHSVGGEFDVHSQARLGIPEMDGASMKRHNGANRRQAQT